jgi:hypothetical protein
MHTSTRTTAIHRTSLIADEPSADGGRALLIEAFDFIHSEGQSGKLVANFRPGGVITSLVFEETTTIPQKAITVEEG